MVEHDLDPEELEQLEQEEDVFGGHIFVGTSSQLISRLFFSRIFQPNFDSYLDCMSFHHLLPTLYQISEYMRKDI